MYPSAVHSAELRVGEQVAIGGSHTLILKPDGTVWACGNNALGQLGLGSPSDYYFPSQVSTLSSVQAISAGANFSVALKTDGTVWTWGDNAYGELGDGTRTQRPLPVQVTALSGVTAISAGDNYCLAVKADGTVWAWGYNQYGQLGDGTTTQRNSPVQVQGLTGIVAAAAGGQFALALASDSTLWAWGYGYDGELGLGISMGISPIPVQDSSPVKSPLKMWRLSDMRRRQKTYTRRFNSRHKLWGHVFGGRYKAVLFESDSDSEGHYLANLLDYIHLNPVRAALVDPRRGLGLLA